MNDIIDQIQQGLWEGNAQLVKEKTEHAISCGINPKNIIQQGLLPMMKSIGQKFREGEIFIPDVLMSSRAMHACLYALRPSLAISNQVRKGVIVFGTVAGDLHDIGKNMVAMMLEGEGYTVIDLGIDVPTTGFISAVEIHKPDVLAMSALLTTTMVELREVVTMLKQKGLRDQVKIMIGGGPVTSEFARAIEADAYASDSFAAIEVVKDLITRKEDFFTIA